jgi:DNA repair photolyase
MEIIYHPKGKAGEYADWAANLFTGCSHGCLYCYVPAIIHKTREDFAKVEPRKNILSKLEDDACYLCLHPEMGKSVFLCFACDPYPPEDQMVTRWAIEILHQNGISVMILTKGGFRAIRDFDLLTPEDQFGVTLTCLTVAESDKWEPGAASPGQRMLSLKKAHDYGIKTWVSLEPVLNPETTLKIIRETHSFVDMYKVGILNYHPHTQSINWRKFGQDVVELLDDLKAKYYIKKDLESYLKVGV